MRRAGVAGTVAMLAALALVAAPACIEGVQGPDDAGNLEGEDAGSDAGSDGGSEPLPDAGSDAGSDAGEDAGTDAGVDPGTPPPVVNGWQVYGSAEGAPARVLGVTADQGGNVWVAGGTEGLFVLRAGTHRFQRFTAADGLDAYPGVEEATARTFSVLSVSGGAAGEVYVGYLGAPDCEFNFYYGQEQRSIFKSGDADRVRLTPTGLDILHYDIYSPPNPASSEPTYRDRGREKICSVYRIVFDGAHQTLWFGSNHGMALAKTDTGEVFEHTHPGAAAYQTETSDYVTFYTGDFRGIAVKPDGDAWIGGGVRSAFFRWGTNNKDFWGSDAFIQTPDHHVDVWPDAEPINSRPSTRTEDNVSSMAVMGDGRVFVGSFDWGLAVIPQNGPTQYVCDRRTKPTCEGTGLVDRSVYSLLRDPSDDSLWVGHGWGGLTRLQGATATAHDYTTFGLARVNLPVRDVQADTSGAARRILAAFETGAVGIYALP